MASNRSSFLKSGHNLGVKYNSLYAICQSKKLLIRHSPLVLINPEIVWASPEKQVSDEGCLSVPGVYDGVERAAAVRVAALDRQGRARTIEAEGVLAVCVQHEMDHLLGKVFVEYLSPLKRNRIKAKMLKARRETVRA